MFHLHVHQTDSIWYFWTPHVVGESYNPIESLERYQRKIWFCMKSKNWFSTALRHAKDLDLSHSEIRNAYEVHCANTTYIIDFYPRLLGMRAVLSYSSGSPRCSLADLCFIVLGSPQNNTEFGIGPDIKRDESHWPELFQRYLPQTSLRIFYMNIKSILILYWCFILSISLEWTAKLTSTGFRLILSSPMVLNNLVWNLIRTAGFSAIRAVTK